MNKNIIIAALFGMGLLGVGWTLYHSPSRTVQTAAPTAPLPATSPATKAALIAELESSVICPVCEGESVAQCSDSTALAIRDAIKQLVSTGMDRETVMAHLRMFGYVEDSPSLPEGHPPIPDVDGGQSGASGLN